jgi:hypothetical protein
MSKSFHAYNITDFLDDSIGRYLSDIETYAIEMAQADYKEERISLLNDIQDVIEQCKEVMR